MPVLHGVLLRVHRAPSANAVALARSVRTRVGELAPRIRGVELRVVADRSSEVTRALAELALAALLGVLFGTLVLRWFLGEWRPTLALAAVVPAALLASFTPLYAAGIPIDTISLAGLALATGLLVDNSIVVLEAIEKSGSVAGGTRQVVRAVIASSFTLMIVFAPLLYLRGLARAVFGEQAIAVVVSVAASLALSLTLTPVLARRTGTGGGGRKAGVDAYLRILGRASKRPLLALAAGALFVALGLAVAMFLPREIFARGAERHVLVEIHTPADQDPDVTTARLAEVWKLIGQRSMTMTRQADGNATFDIETASPAEASRVVDSLRGRVPGTVRLRPSAFIESISGNAERLELIASAATDAGAEAFAKRIAETMKRAGFRAVDDERLLDRRLALMLQWDERLLDASSADRGSVERDVRAALGDFDAGTSAIVSDPQLRLLPTEPRDLAVAPVRLGKQIVPLSAVAGVRLAAAPPPTLRDERRPARKLAFEGGPANFALAAPAGTEGLRVAGHAHELQEAFAQMRLALILAALLLYLTVAAFYESLLLPLPVMAALPFAAAGALLALALTGQSLNLMSLLGLVFLGGVVVNHTVVLLDRTEQLRAEGVGEDEAIRRAAADRYRPVLMTTITAILGMLPLALFGGPGVELRRGIAVTVIGGLITATIGTLVLIPLLHRLIDPLRSPRSAAATTPPSESRREPDV